jgi:hypothetical protein
MPNRFKNYGEVPPGGWRYRQPETGMLMTGADFTELQSKVKAHRRANAFPIGLEFEQEIIDQLCSIMPPGVCEQDIGAVQKGRPLTFKEVVTATLTLGSWIVGGMKRETLQVANERVRVCSGCPYNQKIQGCGSCAMNTVRNMIVDLVGKEKLEYSNDIQGNACAICGCSIGALVWMPSDILNQHEPAETLEKLPAHCWHKP